MTQLSDDNQELARDLLVKLGSNGIGALIATDPGDRSLIERFLALGGISMERYPGLHAAVAGKLTASEAAPTHTAHVVDLGKDRAGAATSRTWVGVSGLPLFAGAVTLVVDADTHLPLAVGAKTTVGESLVQVATHAAAQAASRQTAITLSYAVGQSGAASFGVASQTASTLNDPLTPNITAPVISVTGHTSIVIGLGRPAGYNPDCDYTFMEDAPDNTPPLLVPFAGTVTLPFDITGIGTDGRINGLETNSLIYVGLSTGNPSLPLLPDSLPLACWSDANNPRQLTWSFPYQDPQEPIVYTPASGAIDTPSAFYFQFSVPIDDPSSPLVFAICSTDTPGGESIQCTHIPDVQFTWHCLAAGTLVTLADGTTVPIEQTTNQHRVQTGTGGELAVEANWRGSHDQPVVTVTATAQDGSERSLTLTGEHPVMTPQGLVCGRDLKAGDAVLVEGGTTGRITSATASPPSGQFWNLMLGDAKDRAVGASLGPSTFIANGFVVGDFAAQAAQHRALRRNYDYMLPRLPPEYHVDYASALADV